MQAIMRGAFCLLGLWSCILWAQPGERTHTVQRKETAFGIARQYGVDVNVLFEWNRWAEAGIRKGDVLRIPLVGPAVQPDAGPAVQSMKGATSPAPLSSPEIGEGAEIDSLPGEAVAKPRMRPVPPSWPLDTVRIGVFLPFHGGEDSLGRQAVRLQNIALDCAAGVRLALDSGRWLGAHCEVRFFDTGVDTAGAMKCSERQLDSLTFRPHLVVGPLRRSAFEEMDSWASLEGAVRLVLTDLGDRLVQNRPGVLFPFSPPGPKMERLAQHVAQGHPGERILFLATGDIRNLEAEDAWRAGWTQAEKDSLTEWVEVEVTSRGLGSLRDSLSDVRRNVLVAPGGKASRSFAGVLQTEIQLGDTMDFVLYADGSWRGFEFLDPDLLERVHMTVVDEGGSPPDSVRGVAASDSLHMAMQRRMVEIRGRAVEPYAWLTHDLLCDALSWTVAHGPSWPARLAEGDRLIRPLSKTVWGGMREFHWMAPHGAGSGLVNQYVRLLELEDLMWVELGETPPSSRDSE